MPRVRQGAADKWQRRASVAGPDYQTGVQNPRTSWAAAAGAAKGNYQAGVTAAIARDGYSKGVAQAGDAGWQRGAVNVGVTRYPQGVQANVDRFTAAVTPYLQTIESLTLPAKGAKGDPRNYQRVQQIGEALRKRKLAGGG